MNVQPILVPGDECSLIRDRVAPMIDSALRRSDGEMLTCDVFELIEQERMQLWIGADLDAEGDILACAVTEITDYPRKRICRVVILAGRRMDLWIEHSEAIEEWARSAGCDRIDAMCRTGFERRFKGYGYSKSYIHMGKEL